MKTIHENKFTKNVYQNLVLNDINEIDIFFFRK